MTHSFHATCQVVPGLTPSPMQHYLDAPLPRCSAAWPHSYPDLTTIHFDQDCLLPGRSTTNTLSCLHAAPPGLTPTCNNLTWDHGLIPKVKQVLLAEPWLCGDRLPIQALMVVIVPRGLALLPLCCFRSRCAPQRCGPRLLSLPLLAHALQLVQEEGAGALQQLEG